MELPPELRIVDNANNNKTGVLHQYKTQPVSYLKENSVKFEIPNVGILNSSSCYVEFTTSVGQVGSSFPASIGAKSAFNRVVLESESGKTLCDHRFYNEKSTFENCFRTPEYAHFIDPYLTGSFHTFTINTVGSTDYSTPPNDPKNTLRVAGDPITIDSSGNNSPINDGLSWNRAEVFRQYKGAESTFGQQHSINLVDLLPLFYSHQIPTGIMEKLYLTLYFETDDELGKVWCPVMNNGIAFPADASGNPDPRTYQSSTGVAPNDLFLITDHIIFDDPAVLQAIEEHQEKNNGIAFMFNDYATQLFNITDSDFGGTSQTFEVSRNLASNNYKLCDIKTIEISNDSSGVGVFNIFGKYHSSTPQNSSKQLNFSFNDTNLYPDNSTNKLPVQYDRVSQIYPYVSPNIPRPNYGTEIKPALEPLLNTMFFAGVPLRTGLVNSMNIQGVYLKDLAGKPLQNGNSGIRVFEKYETSVENGKLATGNIQKFFITYLRSLAVSRTGIAMTSEYS